MNLLLAPRVRALASGLAPTLALLLLVASPGCATDDSGGGPYEGDNAGECGDGADNDRDGLFDCDDPDCVGAPICAEGADQGSDIEFPDDLSRLDGPQPDAPRDRGPDYRPDVPAPPEDAEADEDTQIVDFGSDSTPPDVDADIASSDLAVADIGPFDAVVDPSPDDADVSLDLGAPDESESDLPVLSDATTDGTAASDVVDAADVVDASYPDLFSLDADPDSGFSFPDGFTFPDFATGPRARVLTTLPPTLETDPNGITVALRWSEAVDQDIHLRLVEWDWFDTFGDCFWSNPTPDWGRVEIARDNPSFITDERTGPAVEVIRYARPTGGALSPQLYQVATLDPGAGASPELWLWVRGEPVIGITIDLPAASHDWLWVGLEVEWPSGEFRIVDDLLSVGSGGGDPEDPICQFLCLVDPTGGGICDCSAASPEDCDNGRDDNGDGQVDCEDILCLLDPACS